MWLWLIPEVGYISVVGIECSVGGICRSILHFRFEPETNVDLKNSPHLTCDNMVSGFVRQTLLFALPEVDACWSNPYNYP